MATIEPADKGGIERPTQGPLPSSSKAIQVESIGNLLTPSLLSSSAQMAFVSPFEKLSGYFEDRKAKEALVKNAGQLFAKAAKTEVRLPPISGKQTQAEKIERLQYYAKETETAANKMFRSYISPLLMTQDSEDIGLFIAYIKRAGSSYFISTPTGPTEKEVGGFIKQKVKNAIQVQRELTRGRVPVEFIFDKLSRQDDLSQIFGGRSQEKLAAMEIAFLKLIAKVAQVPEFQKIISAKTKEEQLQLCHFAMSLAGNDFLTRGLEIYKNHPEQLKNMVNKLLLATQPKKLLQ